MSGFETPTSDGAGAPAPGGRLVVSAAVDAQQWDRQVVACGGGLFQSHAWAQYVAADGAAEARFFEWRGAGDTVSAVAVGHLRPPSRSPWRRLCQKLSFASPPSGLVAGSRDFAECVTDWARERGSVAEIAFGSYDAHDVWTTKSERLGRPAQRLEFHLALTPEGPGQERLRKGTRYSIKRAEKAGLTVHTGRALEDVRDFSRLHGLTVATLRERKNIALSQPNERLLAESLGALLDGNRARLHVCRGEHGIVAGCLFGVFPPRAYYLLAGLNPAGRDAGAGAFTLFSAICELGRAGFTSINLGGTPAAAARPGDLDHGLYEFKLGFGASPQLCVGGELVLQPWRSRIFSFLAATRRQVLRWRR